MSPDQALALARERQRSGDRAGAERLLERILAAAPDHKGALHELGLIAFNAGRGEQAETLLRRAVDGNAPEPLHLRNLGVVLQQRGKDAESEIAYRRALALEPEAALNHYNLGLLLLQQSRLTEAETCYRRAVELKPDWADAWNNLAATLQKLEQLDEAETCYRRALELAPEDTELVYNLACVLGARRRLDEAEQVYRRALAMRPDYAKANLNLSVLLAECGRSDEAEGYARRAVDLAPADPETLAHYAACHRFTPFDPGFGLLQAGLETATGPRRALVLAALGKAHDDIDACADAFDYFHQANEADGRAQGFDPEGYRQLIDDIRRANLTVDPNQDPPVPDRTAVFVVGMSRSGKTLAESLLARHPDVHAAGESQEWEQAVKAVLTARRQDASFPACLPHLESEDFERIGATYLERMSSESPGSRFFVNTLPGYFAHLGLILRCLPGARVIHCRRHPLDNCLYMYFKQYRSGHEYSYSLEHLAVAYRAYRELMAHWADRYGDRLLEVRYEDLVRHPQETTDRLYAYCGLEGSGELGILFHEREIDRWRRYETFIGSLIAALDGRERD